MESANSSLDQPQNPENAALSNGKKREFVCPDCQLVCRDSLRLRQHAFGHLLAAGWECAVCGVRFAHGLRDRNRHEQNMHGLVRHTADLQRKEAVRITKHQLAGLVNVGNRLVVTQLAARPSLSAANDDEATVDELRAHMLETLRSRNLEIPVVECELPTATEDLPQPAEQPSEQTAVENSLDGMPAKSAQKRSQRVVPVQPFERRELFGSDDDEEETSMLIGPSNPKIRKMSAPSIAVPSGSHTGEAAARLNGESSALSVSQSGEETAGWSVRLRSQDATNSKSQPVKEDLRQAPLFESEDEEEAEGGDTSGDFDSSQPKNSAMLDCSVCGLPVAVQHFRKHSKGHSRKIGWQCALCGIRVATQRKRREHEDGFHALRRCRFDQDRQEAILLDEPQLKTLRSIGTNFREIQRGAVRSVAAFIQLPTLLAASRQASGGATESRRPTDVVVLDD